jgi:hypothetical protein
MPDRICRVLFQSLMISRLPMMWSSIGLNAVSL